MVYNATQFTTYSESERVWTKLAALREAMNEYPHSEWFWYLDQVLPPPHQKQSHLIRIADSV